MYRTKFEELGEVLNPRRNRTPNNVAILRTRVWVEAILYDHKISRKEFEQLISKDAEPSGQVLKWLKGSNSVSKSKVDQVAKWLPNSDKVYSLPLYDLLQNRPISKNQLHRYMADYINQSDPEFFWKLPNSFNGIQDGVSTLIMLEINLDELYQRGGIFSFIAILYIMRKAEAERDAELHFEAVTYAYKSFPSLARHPYFKNRWQEILNALKEVHWRVTTSALLVKPDKYEIDNQINAKDFVTFRPLRPRHPTTHRFIDNKDPFKIAQFGNSKR